MRLTDTHCHLYDERAFPDPVKAVETASAAGVDRLVVVGVDTDTSRKAIALAERFAGVYAVAGWHPNYAADFTPESVGEIREMLSHPKVVALGEIGLDYHWDYATQEQQMRALRMQLDLAYETEMPVVFHCREAYDDLLAILEKEPAHKWLFHCFAGDEEHAIRAQKLDSWFGVDGPITYPKNEALRTQFAALPGDKILIETDAPYMAPVPHRGQRNHPAHVVFVNEALAKARSITPAECAALTSANADNFFGLP